MRFTFFKTALGLSMILAGSALAQEPEGEWRVLERPNGAILVRLFGHDVDPSPDHVFECERGKKAITARAYATFSMDWHQKSLLAYDPRARAAEGCDDKCVWIMEKFGASKPSRYAVGSTTYKVLAKAFDRDVRDSQWRMHDDTAAVKRAWRVRLSIFKSRCGL